MKLAFLNRGRDAYPGGDAIALDATMDALRRKGVECVETGWDTKAMKDGGFDLAHIFHCNFSWSWGNYESLPWLKRYNDPVGYGQSKMRYVLTPVYYPGLLSGITQEQLAQIVHGAELVLPFSNREAMELRESVGYFPYEAIPNGTDPSFHCSTPACEREGVLCVSARGLEDKGIPMVCAACERLGLPFTAVTGVPHNELPAIYVKHRVFVNASDSERMSLTVGEALCAGCKVIAHYGNRGNEHYGSFLPRFESEYYLEPLLRSVYESSWNDPVSNAAARALTWDLAADRLIEVYRWALR